MPKIAKYEQPDEPDVKRRNTVGKIELNQLEIPTIYKHSNVAIEKYKSNPEYYLPNGLPKRKFSLPKLTDSFEQVKTCGYLRRSSLIEASVAEEEIQNIFNFSRLSNKSDEYEENDNES